MHKGLHKRSDLWQSALLRAVDSRLHLACMAANQCQQ